MKNLFLICFLVASVSLYSQVPSNIVNLHNRTSCVMAFTLKVVNNSTCNSITVSPSIYDVQPNSSIAVDVGTGNSVTGVIVQEFGFGGANCFTGQKECGNAYTQNLNQIAIGGQFCLESLPAFPPNTGLYHRYHSQYGDNFWILY